MLKNVKQSQWTGSASTAAKWDITRINAHNAPKEKKIVKAYAINVVPSSSNALTAADKRKNVVI